MTMYKQDPNDSRKQIPQPLIKTSRGRAITPTMLEQYANPSHVFINNSGSYHFRYDCTGSAGDTPVGGYELGMVVDKIHGLPIKLDINPCSWSGSYGVTDAQGGSQKTGDVTFVYRGQ
jgi:hypothetical protein